jgi:hypothetical protein
MEIVLIAVIAWVVFTACVLALLRAAKVADEAADGDREPLPAPARFEWRPAAPMARPGRPATHGR